MSKKKKDNITDRQNTSDPFSRSNEEAASSSDEPEQESVFSFIKSLGILIFLVFAFKSTFIDANNIPSGSMIPTLKVGDFLFVNKMRYSLRIPFTGIELWRIDDPKRGDIVTFIPPGDAGKHYVKRVVGMPGDRIRITNVPACELESAGLLDIAEREYSCEEANFYPYQEPVVAFIEYKENDEGLWQNYFPQEVSSTEAREVLTDSDNTRVLHPDQNPGGGRRVQLPVLFEETVGDKTYYTVEKVDIVPAFSLCEEVETEGCVIPEEEYFVMGDNRDDSRDSRYDGLIERENILGKALVIYFSINWWDDICEAYRLTYADRSGEEGFILDDFSPDMQARYCSNLDVVRGESIGAYFKRTLQYRIPRLSVRWNRIGQRIH